MRARVAATARHATAAPVARYHRSATGRGHNGDRVHDHERVGDEPAGLGATATGDGADRPSPAHLLAAAGAAAAVGLYAWWAVGLTPFTGTASLAVVLAGGAAVGVGAWGHRPAVAAPRGRVAPWLVVVAALAVVQLSAYVQHPREDHPTLSSLTNALLDTHHARAAALVAWLVAARGLARR
jgi:hypothetical protein